MLKQVQDKPDLGVFYRYDAFNFDDAMLVHFTDASHAADWDVSMSDDGNRSQSGRVLCLADPSFVETGQGHLHLLEYHSDVIRRVCRSTMQAETLTLVQGYEESDMFVLFCMDSNTSTSTMTG